MSQPRTPRPLLQKRHRPLTPSVKFVVACSDGVWDVLDNAAVVKLVGDHLKSFTGGAMQNAAKGACAA